MTELLKIFIKILNLCGEKLVWFIMKYSPWSGDLDDNSHGVYWPTFNWEENKVCHLSYSCDSNGHKPPTKIEIYPHPIRAQCQVRPTNRRAVLLSFIRGVTQISDCVNWDIMKVKFLARLSRWLGKFSDSSVTNHDNDDDNNDNYWWLRCSRLTTCCHLLSGLSPRLTQCGEILEKLSRRLPPVTSHLDYISIFL